MVLVFDLNGTLLNTRILEPKLRAIFGSRYSVTEWFDELLLYSQSLTLAGQYREFGDIAIAVLRMAAQAHGVSITISDVESVRSALTNMPPFPDVRKALDRLRRAGFRMSVLSNSSPSALPQQLENGGLDDYFEHALSVSSVRRFKPAPETYQFAARTLGVSTQDVVMVAAHPWDLIGAARAGCRTAFIARPGQALLPGSPADYTAGDLNDLADELTGTQQSRDDQRTSPLIALAAGTTIAAAAMFALLRTSR